MVANTSIEANLEVNNLSKKFNKQKLFSELSFNINAGNILAVTGANGSGKSTLLKIIAGLIPAQKGEVNFYINHKKVENRNLHKHINICAPYLEIIEEFTLLEQLEFHAKFKPLKATIEINKVIEAAGLLSSLNKNISDFSSGMKQRLKLILTFCYQANILLIDEPTSHLDEEGKNWYKTLIEGLSKNQILIIFSNEREEYASFTNNLINIESIK